MKTKEEILKDKHLLSVLEFSMLPLQAGLEIETPDGIGKYEGITSSGIVTVFIGGGLKQYSWSDCTPKIMLRHVLMMEDFVNKWRDKHSVEAVDSYASHLSERVKELEEEVEWLKRKKQRVFDLFSGNRKHLKARIKELESQQQPVKEVLKKAELMYTALNKLLTGLAKDGTAIDGFTDGWKATQEYTSALLEYQIILSSPPNQNVKE